MSTGRLTTGVCVMALCAALGSCIAVTPAARSPRQPLPISVASPTLAVRVDARFLAPHKTDLAVWLTARQTLPSVEVRVSSPDPRLEVPARCTLHPLQPPHAAHGRRPPLPLPVVPICNLIVSAGAPGRYPIDLRIHDGAGRDLVQPIHTVVRIRIEP